MCENDQFQYIQTKTCCFKNYDCNWKL